MVAAGAGRIGMTWCPGRAEHDLFASVPGAVLDAQLATIAAWRPGAFVSLIERAEFDWYGVSALPERASQLGLRHLHLPIEDMGVPDAGFEQRWQVHGPELRRLLYGGGSVLLHCLAGLGRTGTIAARLLVEIGMPPAEAVRAVRTARPGTIQTRDQERHVYACRAQDGAIAAG